MEAVVAVVVVGDVVVMGDVVVVTGPMMQTLE